MPLNNTVNGVTQVTSANADISVANGSTAPALTLNSGTGNNQIVKLDSSGRLPNIDGSQLTNISATADVTYLNTQQLEQDIAIIELQANSSLPASDYSTMFLDTLSDSSGYDNTVDTGASTTAIYDAVNKKYKNSDDTWNDTSSRTHGVSVSSSFSNSSKSGWKITTKTSQIKLKSVTMASGNAATVCYLYASNKSTLIDSTTSRSGDTFTFATPPLLSASTTYYIVANNSGSSYSDRNATGGSYSYPYDLTEANLVASADNSGSFGNDVTSEIYSVVSAVFQTSAAATPADKIMQTNTITVSSNLTAYQLFCKNVVASSGTVQFKVSFDNGSTWTSAKELNTKYSNSTTGTSIKVQILLNGSGSGNTSEAYNYALMVWY